MENDEELMQRRRERIEQLRTMQIGGRGSQSEIANPRVIVAQAIKREYPDLPYDEVQKAAREVVLAPHRASVKIGQDDVPVADLQFKVAESIELLNSETNSAQEYFSWFEETATIMKHMNDGFVSNDDLKERNDWVKDSYTREAELQTCLALYQSSSFPEARKRYDILYNKLCKLRQLRTAIKECTSRHSDESAAKLDKQQKRDDYEKAKIYVAAVREFIKHDPRWNMPRRTLMKLRIYRGDDPDLMGEYDWFYGAYESDVDEDTASYPRNPHSYEDDLKEYVLFHWDDIDKQAPENSYAEDIRSNRFANATREDIARRIAELSGRRPPAKNTPFGPRENRIKSFDASRFSRLSDNENVNG